MACWNLAESNYSQIGQQSFEVAVLPLGATEPHNFHLPYATDTLQCNVLGTKICESATQQGAQVVLLPTIPYGTETNMRQFPLAINLNPSTLNLVVKDIVDSLVDSGIRKIVLLNGHGGNELKPLLRELAGKTPAHLFLCNWYQVIADQYFEIFEEKEDHAGEMETSFGLAYFPQLVGQHPDGRLIADAGATQAAIFEGLNRGWVSISRPWHLLTTNSGSGNPHKATAAKGEKLVEILVQRLGSFLVELAQAPLDENFPFNPR